MCNACKSNTERSGSRHAQLFQFRPKISPSSAGASVAELDAAGAAGPCADQRRGFPQRFGISRLLDAEEIDASVEDYAETRGRTNDDSRRSERPSREAGIDQGPESPPGALAPRGEAGPDVRAPERCIKRRWAE